MNISATFEKK